MHTADGDTSPTAHEKKGPSEQELYACVDSYLCDTQIVYKGWYGERSAELANGKMDENLARIYNVMIAP